MLQNVGPFRRSFQAALSFGLSLLMIVVIASTLRADIEAEAVQKAIERGVAHLKQRQLPSGTWTEYNRTQRGGMTALCTLALLECGVKPEIPQVEAALKWLRTNKLETTYAVALETMVFCKASPKRDAMLIQRNVDWLESTQTRKGPFSGGWSYPAPSSLLGRGADNSNSQFALLALDAAERVGAKVRPATWRLAGEYWTRGQNPDGSWGYILESRGNGTGSMTCAGIASMVIAGGQIARSDVRIKEEKIICCAGGSTPGAQQVDRGIDWLAKKFSLSTNPGMAGSQWRLYYLYGLERVGRLTARRFIGKHDWYREGADRLVRQEIAGANYWTGSGMEQNDLLATSFALLFLSKGRRPVLMSKLEYGPPEAWNPHPADVANLTRYVEAQWERDMTWQVVDLARATVDDLLQSPVLFFGGRGSPLPTDEAEAQEVAEKLRGYLDRGGFLFADAQCEGETFDRGFRALMERVFPETEYALRLLEPDHSIWWAEEPIPPDLVRPLWGVDFGCRTSVVYAPPNPPGDPRPSLSCLWELSRAGRETTYPESVRNKVAAGLSIGINVLAYATNRQLKHKDEIPADLTPVAEEGIDGRGEVAIATLRHPGGCSVAPRAVVNLLETASEQLNLRTRPERIMVNLTDPRLFDFHLVFMHGRSQFRLTEKERKQLRTYLERGGMLFADAICASPTFAEAFRRELQAVFPDRPLEPIPTTDPLLSSTYGGFDVSQLTRVEPAPRQTADAGPRKPVQKKMPTQLEGIRLGDRWAVIFSPFDVSCALDRHSGLECRGYTREDAARLALNILLYSLQQ